MGATASTSSPLDATVDPTLFPPTLIRGVRLVPVAAATRSSPGQGPPATVASAGPPPGAGPVDLRIRAGLITEVGTALTPEPGEQIHDAAGCHAIPGLWDQHVHMGVWAATFTRLDTSGTSAAEQVLARVRAHLRELTDPESIVVGFGHRSAVWPRQPSVAELDAVSGLHPVALISGDAHNGWLNTAALRLLDAPRAAGALTENDWFPVFARIAELPAVRAATEAAYEAAVQAANDAGVIGIVDMEFGAGYLDWVPRFTRGVRGLRVRAATYAAGLPAVVAAGLPTGADLGDTGGLLTMGPLKVISDGSLNTRSAYCRRPYADAADLQEPCGWPNLDLPELTDLVRTATAAGLEVAVHAIGDAAVGQALEAIAAVGARGTIEHAQLVGAGEIAQMARLAVAASVQPAHLLDDRDVTLQCWPDRADQCFALQSMRRAGVELRLGSDAPVSPLDPWLAMAAAVHRSGDQRPPWNASEALSVAEALSASTDGQGTLAVGSRGDVVLLDADPIALEADSGSRGGSGGPSGSAGSGDTAVLAARLRAIRPVATFLAGRLVAQR